MPATNPDEASLIEPGLRFATTYGDADGNRYVTGVGSIQPDDHVEQTVSGVPAWLVGIADGPDVVLVMADTEGALSGFTIGADGVSDRELNLAVAAPGTPPSLVAGHGVLVILPPGASGSPDSNALALESGGLAFVGSDGAVIVTDKVGNRRIELNAVTDGRLTLSSDRRLGVLVDPTDRYDHGVVGDRFEASGVAFVSLDTQEVVRELILEGDVFEGMVGMFADLDGDEVDEYIMTVSNPETGARLVVLDDNADLVAESDPIGEGGRWRHQIAAAPFGPNGEVELVDVRTPHIGGVVEYFAMRNGQLELVASLEGFSSHTIGSRNLDMAVAFDVDGDGQVELVVPNTPKDALAVLRRVGDSVEVVMTLPLGGVLSTNLVAVEVAGHVVLAAGTADGRLLIWR
ncbi:MAG: hypothetical protein JJE47_16375 [Acidimicrobiia bacterium]|nr:hypothetical protein [Acidimicrobiia bacterium]